MFPNTFIMNKRARSSLHSKHRSTQDKSSSTINPDQQENSNVVNPKENLKNLYQSENSHNIILSKDLTYGQSAEALQLTGNHTSQFTDENPMIADCHTENLNEVVPKEEASLDQFKGVPVKNDRKIKRKNGRNSPMYSIYEDTIIVNICQEHPDKKAAFKLAAKVIGRATSGVGTRYRILMRIFPDHLAKLMTYAKEYPEEAKRQRMIITQTKKNSRTEPLNDDFFYVKDYVDIDCYSFGQHSSTSKANKSTVMVKTEHSNSHSEEHSTESRMTMMSDQKAPDEDSNFKLAKTVRIEEGFESEPHDNIMKNLTQRNSTCIEEITEVIPLVSEEQIIETIPAAMARKEVEIHSLTDEDTKALTLPIDGIYSKNAVSNQQESPEVIQFIEETDQENAFRSKSDDRAIAQDQSSVNIVHQEIIKIINESEAQENSSQKTFKKENPGLEILSLIERESEINRNDALPSNVESKIDAQKEQKMADLDQNQNSPKNVEGSLEGKEYKQEAISLGSGMSEKISQFLNSLEQAQLGESLSRNLIVHVFTRVSMTIRRTPDDLFAAFKDKFKDPIDLKKATWSLCLYKLAKRSEQDFRHTAINGES